MRRASAANQTGRGEQTRAQDNGEVVESRRAAKFRFYPHFNEISKWANAFYDFFK
jgi:hypothetical protein